MIRISDTFGCMDFSQVDTDAIPGFSDDAFYLRGFGSDALMQARNLRIPAVVNLLPDGHPERAVTNLFTKELHSLVYVPDRFDIVPFVPFTAPTEITYYHLSYLRKKFGESVYRTPIDTLRKTEPGLFFGIYDDHLPVEVDETFTYSGTNFEEAKRKEVTRRAEKSGKVRLIHEVFEDPLVVDGVIASKDAEVRIVTGFEKPVSPRAYFFDRTDDSERIVTNFSFFFTERLRYIYNNLREGRP